MWTPKCLTSCKPFLMGSLASCVTNLKKFLNSDYHQQVCLEINMEKKKIMIFFVHEDCHCSVIYNNAKAETIQKSNPKVEFIFVRL